jgi:competence protein ComEC
MPVPRVHFWKKMPFIRLLAPLSAGILIQWHLQVPGVTWFYILMTSFICLVVFFLVPLLSRYLVGWMAGIAITLLFASLGAILAINKDIRNDSGWVGNHYRQNDFVIVTTGEPLVEKPKSFKADAQFESLIRGEQTIGIKGGLVIYFKKDSSLQTVGYGTRILIKKSLQLIKASGNPGGFDYKRYSLFHGSTHQVYLQPGEFVLLPRKKENGFHLFLLTTRERILAILRRYITEDKALGLAEALLIGYKDDLDKSLVQSYTNTGVVHIIAISGLHLGLIYGLLVMLFKPLRRNKKWKWLRPVMIIAGLWLFSFLAGAQPSVLRSALMFTCIVLGEYINRRGSIINTMAVSAFILLCMNPYWLWDPGFQLSYAAVLSIILFMRPIYNWFYFKNKLLDFTWKLNAVTLSAQILTVPFGIYHFHQFPNYFLFTNFIAVPVSSIIVLALILLCTISWLPVIAAITAQGIVWLIHIMNSWIERVNRLPFAVWYGLQISSVQGILLLLFFLTLAYGLIEKKKWAFTTSGLSILFFFVFRSYDFIRADHQRKLVIYNIPGHSAIDWVEGRCSFFTGDPEPETGDFSLNFYLNPSRTLYRTHVATRQVMEKGFYCFDTGMSIPGYILVVSGKARLFLAGLTKNTRIGLIVFDSSVPFWKLRQWKKECDSLRIPYYDVAVQGAFVMNMR